MFFHPLESAGCWEAIDVAAVQQIGSNSMGSRWLCSPLLAAIKRC
jgi:hypothetical protein